MNIKQKYCGYISIIGKANVGKSTLLNKIIGKKISIVSRKKNTTQNNIIGVKTENHYQSIYTDTPGIFLNKNKNQIEYKKSNFYKTIKSSTLIMFVIDRTHWTEHDEIILNEIKKNKTPIIVVINKIDKISNKIILLPFIKFLKKKIDAIEIIPISTGNINNIFLLKNIIKSFLPKKTHLYSENYITTNSEEFTLSEMIREELIVFLGDELPSIIKIKIESLKKKENKELYINAIIWVKNVRQKRIIIGHHGEIIKKVSMISRKKIEKELCIKTHLFLWIKDESSKKIK